MKSKALKSLAAALITAQLLTFPLSMMARVGILPYARWTNRQGRLEPYFLFSENAKRPGEWTDFSGHGELNENDAAKAGFAGTMGIFQGYGKMPGGEFKDPTGPTNKNYDTEISNLALSLRTAPTLEGKFSVYYPLYFRFLRGARHTWKTYLINVTRKAGLMVEGSLVRLLSTLVGIHNKYPKKRWPFNRNEEFREKTNFRWVSKTDLLKAMQSPKGTTDSFGVKLKINNKLITIFQEQGNLAKINRL